ncbi:MAG: hypothetical protein ACRD3K_08765 [Edaphobacter sp.]
MSVSDTYTFSITYSDRTTGILTASVTAVLTTFATNLAPTTGTSVSTTPTFTWTDPVCTACSSYTLGKPKLQPWPLKYRSKSGALAPGVCLPVTGASV